ncbi:unnamed protein product, partial [Porites evermanni]
AARDGKIDLIVQKLRKFGRHNTRRLKAINKCDEHDITPLHYAIRYGHVDVVKLLVEHGAEIDKQGEDGALPLHYAARFRSSATRQLANRQASQLDTTDGEVSSVVAPLAQAISNNSLTAGQNGLQVNDADESESLISYLVQCKADVNARDHYLMTPLHYAASKANLTAVKELLQFDGIKIDAVDTSGSTALHCAATDGAVEIVKTLLEAGADARAKDYDKMTPIHFACTDGNLDTVKTLFEHAEKSCELSTMLDERNRDGETALHAAVEGGYVDIVQLCLEKGANVRSRRANLAHPLHIAAINGHVEIAKCLMQHHAKIEARNVNHETPLHKAAASNKPRMVELLLEKGADIECLDKDNYTPLLVAASEGHTNVVQLLLNRGANLKAKDTQDKTAIFLAAEENCIDTLREILKHGDAKVLVDECDLYENTPLHVAAKKGYALVTEALLSHDARIDARNEDENTPLHLAAENGKVRTVVELLRKDPSIINDEDEASNTALHLAATEGHLKCCKELLERGAEVDARNSTLWTPLDCAAAKGHLKVASLLLEFDSPIDPTDKAKTTPLHLAAREGHPEVVSLLLSKGADITLTDHTGRNCLDLAIDNGRKEAARAIVNDENWMQAMRNKTWEQRRVTTPMRKLIIKLPEVAEIVFNRCIKESGVNSEDENYQITLYYEFLEDVYSDWLDNDGTASETSSVASFSMEDEIPEDDMYQRLRGKSAMEEAVKQLEEKKSHPLMIMVKNQREQLLGHPLVTFLLHYKWQTFGRYIYYFKLSLYIIFLFFLTGYTVYSTDNAPNCNKTNAAVSNDLKESVPYFLWIEVGRIVILALASWHILSELFQMFYQRRQYSIFENLLEWAVYVLAIIYVADEFDVPLVNRCSEDKQTIGALSIFCAWMALVLFIRKFPRLGIYVVMFTSIMYTFTKFFLIFVLFLVAFALAFYTLLKDQQVSNMGLI